MTRTNIIVNIAFIACVAVARGILAYLLCLSIRVARVVYEAGDVPLPCGIYKLVRLEGHEVEVGGAVPAVVLAATAELALVEHLPHVLHDEGAPGEKGGGVLIKQLG